MEQPKLEPKKQKKIEPIILISPAWSEAPPMARLSAPQMLDMASEAGVVFFQWDAHRGLIYVSDSAKQLLGYTALHLRLNPALAQQIIHPESRAHLAQFAAQLRDKKPRVARTEVQFVTQKGNSVWVEARVIPQYDDAGEVAGFFGVALDATELVELRRGAEEGRMHYRLLFESAPVPMLFLDAQHMRVLEANERACHLFGSLPEEIEGRALVDLLIPDERDRVTRQFQVPRARGEPMVVPRTFGRRPDGVEFPLQLAAAPVSTEGRPRVLAILRDLTETEETHDALSAMRREVETSQEAVMILDRTRRLVFANRACQSAVGRPFEELHGEDPAALTAPGWGEEWRRGVDMAMVGWLWRGIVTFVHRDGETREFDVELVPAATPVGLCTHVVAILHAAPAADDSDSGGWRQRSSSGVFVSMLSRYVENSLVSARSRLDLVATSGVLPPDLRSDVVTSEFLVDTSIEFARFIRQIHTQGREASAGAPVAQGDLVEILNEVGGILGPICEVRRTAGGDGPMLVRAPVYEPDVVREVMLNLVASAGQPEGKQRQLVEVTLRSTELGGRQAFQVRVAAPSHGGPVPTGADLLAGATGYTLALCRDLVERSGGVLTVDAGPTESGGQGIVYWAVFPSAGPGP